MRRIVVVVDDLAVNRVGVVNRRHLHHLDLEIPFHPIHDSRFVPFAAGRNQQRQPDAIGDEARREEQSRGEEDHCPVG